MSRSELSEKGQELLRCINAIVAASGVELEGNLFYFHLYRPAIGDAPDEGRVAKRRNFQRTLYGQRSLLEIGFNAGHSALLALDANPELTYVGIDIASNPYTVACGEILRFAYGPRFQLHVGDSRIVAPRLIIQSGAYQFDVVHVDGGHDPLTAQLDLSSALLACKPEGIVLMDDTGADYIKAIVDEHVALGVAEVETFDGQWEGNESVAIRPRAARFRS
jgi:hypothetical protein